jgi:hypothetical protein
MGQLHFDSKPLALIQRVPPTRTTPARVVSSRSASGTGMPAFWSSAGPMGVPSDPWGFIGASSAWLSSKQILLGLKPSRTPDGFSFLEGVPSPIAVKLLLNALNSISYSIDNYLQSHIKISLIRTDSISL